MGSPSDWDDKQIYSVLFTGLLINMFVPVALWPGTRPSVRELSMWYDPLTTHTALPVTLHVSSIGNRVRPGIYVTLLGPLIIVPIQL